MDAGSQGFLLPTVVGSFDSPVFGATRSTTAEVSLLIVEVLGNIQSDWDLSDIGAHSLKPTLLSWCAKYGLALSVRRRLGGHAKARDKSVLAYSRDELSEPMRLLQEVLQAVRDKRFDPDATRSGLWSSVAEGVEQKCEEVQVQVQEQAGSSGDAPATPVVKQDDSDAESLPSSSSGGEEVAMNVSEHWFNPKSGMYHLLHEADPQRLACGRMKSEGLRAADFTSAYADAAARCKGCYREG